MVLQTADRALIDDSPWGNILNDGGNAAKVKENKCNRRYLKNNVALFEEEQKGVGATRYNLRNFSKRYYLLLLLLYFIRSYR